MWLPEKVKIVEMPWNRAEGGYGEIRRVRIATMAGIPTDCDFTAKKSKAATPLLQRQAQSMEACVNPSQASGHDKVLGSSPQNNGIILIVVECVRAQINKRLKETLRSRITSVTF